MITQEGVDYIKNQLHSGKNREEVTKSLLTSGWKQEDINSAFSAALNPGVGVPSGGQVPAKSSKKGCWIAAAVVGCLGLLVIIPILAAVIMVAVNPVKQFEQARNTERIADLGLIKKAIAMYFTEKSAVPMTLSELVPTYMAAVPTDPQSKLEYEYTSDGIKYTVCATMEKTEKKCESGTKVSEHVLNQD